MIDMKKKDTFKIQFPIVKNVCARTIAQDIKGFNPNNPNDVKEWAEQQKKLWDSVKKQFDDKGIPMPTVVIDRTPGPITYAIKTVDENENTLHSLFYHENTED